VSGTSRSSFRGKVSGPEHFCCSKRPARPVVQAWERSSAAPGNVPMVPGATMLQENVSTDAAACAMMLLKRSAQDLTLVQ
jgi:hypothetical protein